MVANPVILLLILYFTANFFALLNGISLGGFYFYDNFYNVSTSTYISAFFLQCIFTVLIFVFWRFAKIKYKNIEGGLEIRNGGAVFLGCLQIAFILFVLFTGAGKAGSDFKFESGNIFNYFFILTKPDVLVLILAPFLISNRAYWVVIFIYFISLLIRGWMGAIFFIIILTIIRFYPIRISLSKLPGIFIISLFILLLLPVLEAFKWGMRGDIELSALFGQVFDTISLDLYFKVIEYVISRFSHVDNVALIVQNSNLFADSFSKNEFRSLFFSGVVYESICRLAGDCPTELGTYLAMQFYDSPGSWNADPGLFSWFYIDGLQSIVLVLIFIPFFILMLKLLAKYFGLKGILLFLSFSIIYLYHGWYGAFQDFFLYLVFSIVIIRMFFLSWLKFGIKKLASKTSG